MQRYDIVTVGGGVGGSALAKAMAERGARVLVVEREARFKDRVRGGALAPWGVAEAQALGLLEVLRDRCGHVLRYWNVHAGGNRVVSRDLFATTPQKTGWLAFYHPDMQEAVLEGVLLETVAAPHDVFYHVEAPGAGFTA
jgi:2-polyprenyl-6-methoxyphenol hydroxylase-like FAD-dependent oxidoreductase